MEPVIRLDNVDLIYRSAESLSFKKMLRNLVGRGQSALLHQYKALNNVSITLEKGKVYGIIGNNGAGKSTLLRILSGVMSPNSGTVERNYTTINLLALGVGFTKELTGEDNIYLNGMLLGFSRKQIDAVKDDIVEYSEIGSFIERPMKTYSSGMVSRLGFAIAIHLKPEVLLIDEVLSVGDTKFRQKSFDSIRKIIGNRSVTVAIVSHSMNQVEALCDSVIWLEKGRVVAQGEKSEVLELYSRYNAGELSIKDILAETGEDVRLENGCLELDAEAYSLRIQGARELSLNGKPYDLVKEYVTGRSTVRLTARTLDNGDLFLYFEVERPLGLSIRIGLDKIEDVENFDHLYRPPAFDKRYGHNRVSGFQSYLNLEHGSALVSKLYLYRSMARTYENGDVSRIYKLQAEMPGPCREGNNTLLCRFDTRAKAASFFVLLSREKLFRDQNNLSKYMSHYFDSIYNSGVWCSFFMQPSGTYTKLPYSIEPFTKKGYGFSLSHSARKDLIPFYQQNRERFFEDMIINSVLQTQLYQEQEDGVILTPYTSTWVKEDFGITAPYVDTRLNEHFVLMLEDMVQVGLDPGPVNALLRYAGFLVSYYKSGGRVHRLGDGMFFPDYIKKGSDYICNASLNHQLGVAMVLLKASLRSPEGDYREIFDSMMSFLRQTEHSWIKEEDGDLYYGIRPGWGGDLEFYGDDYVYVTLGDLLSLKKLCVDHGVNGDFKVLDRLVTAKVNYLRKGPYDLFNSQSAHPPGEKIYARVNTLRLYQALYGSSSDQAER